MTFFTFCVFILFQKLDTPWRKIVTSMPLWAVFISHLGQNWGFWTLLTEMPNYVNAVLGVNIQNVSIRLFL